MLRIFGCDTLEEFKALTGYTFKGLVHPEDIDEVEKSIGTQIAHSGENLDYVEYRIIRKDGTVRWVEDYGHLYIPILTATFSMFLWRMPRSVCRGVFRSLSA